VKVFIQHAPGQVNHNQVGSPTAVISVRGTVFDVVVEDGDGTTVVSVDEGLVRVQHRIVAGDPVYVNPGESIRVFKDQRLAIAKPDKSNAIQYALKSAREALWQVLRGQQGGGAAGVPGSGSPGPQGDKKPTTTVPGAPPPLPGGH
jgi:hypothetical protein